MSREYRKMWCFMFSYVDNANVAHLDDSFAFDNRQRRRHWEGELEKSELTKEETVCFSKHIKIND
jgi:hypothetical protein